MKENNRVYFCTICFIAILLVLQSCKMHSQYFTVNIQEEVIETKPHSPFSFEAELNKTLKKALLENRLMLVEISDNGKNFNSLFPVQLDSIINKNKVALTFFIPPGKTGIHNFKLVESKLPASDIVEVKLSTNNKQYVICEGDTKILQYNYKLVYEDDVIRPNSKKETKITYRKISGVYYDEYLRANPQEERNDTTTSRIYGIPRSDYIHPLRGLDGEMLTCDWPDGTHPHHRGIFWAWPEVEYKSEFADIYALQRVFARPTGNITNINGPIFAEIKAENSWMWEDKSPIVTENVTIRAYRSNNKSRVIDLTITLQAMVDSVTIATRFTNRYGGLNIRMQTPKDQQIYHFTNKPESDTIRAWGGFNGTFEGNNNKSGLIILQNKNNPNYPGSWYKTPKNSWVQPTFPTPKTRYYLNPAKPLVLKYRLIIHSGEIPDEKRLIKEWDVYNMPNIEATHKN